MGKQVYASEINLEKLDILTGGSRLRYNLIPHLVELNIYENIFLPNLSANITLTDASNLPATLPIVGEEKIEVVYSLAATDGKREKVSPALLHTHDLKGRFLKSPQSEQFTLDLVSEQYINNSHTRISKSYSDGTWTASDIVQDIWSNYMDDDHGDLDVEESEGIVNCVIPNWTPYQVFNWLCDRTYSESDFEGRARNYLYYETMDESHFKSLHMMAQDNEHDIVFTLNPRVVDPTKVMGLSGSHKIIKAEYIKYGSQFQKIKNINEGMYASKLITHDIVKKKILQHDYNMVTDYAILKADEKVSGNPVISFADTHPLKHGYTYRTQFAPTEGEPVTEGRHLFDFTDSKVDYYPKHNQMFATNTGTLHDNEVENWLQRRSSQMVQYDGIRMMVRCSGVSFIRIGMVVTLLVPSPSSRKAGQSEEAFDRYLSGKYIITAIRHILGYDKGETTYAMLVELRKDGVANDLFGEK